MTRPRLFNRTIPHYPDCVVFDGATGGEAVAFHIYIDAGGLIVADSLEFDLAAATPAAMESKLARFQVGPASFAGYDQLGR